MKNDETRKDADEAPETQRAQTQGGAENQARADLDFETLDLSVETVEERISPSETNVFDK